MTPKIDYTMLGQALTYYTDHDFEYVEVPWIVDECAIRATLPEWAQYMELGQRVGHPEGFLRPVYGCENALIGSAEQGFLTLALPPGRYVGVTPCFRLEETNDLFTRDTFMKVELFDNRDNAEPADLVDLAAALFRRLVGSSKIGTVRTVAIEDTTDITLNGIEIGSYGARVSETYGRWVYGTGLALPRFSVAQALTGIL